MPGPLRMIGALERRFTVFRHPVENESTTPPVARAPGHSHKPVYWVGDERETTQGDW